MAVCAARLAARFAAVALFNCSTVKFDIRNYACNFNKPIECAHGIVTIFKVNRVFKNPDYPVRMPAADYRKLLTSRLSSIDKFAVCRDVLSLMDTLAVVAKAKSPVAALRATGLHASTANNFSSVFCAFPRRLLLPITDLCNSLQCLFACPRRRRSLPKALRCATNNRK